MLLQVHTLLCFKKGGSDVYTTKESNKANVQKTQMIEHLTYYSCLFMPGTTKKNRFIEYINLLHSSVIKKRQFQSLYSQALSGFKYQS